jgi:hypothetical protein
VVKYNSLQGRITYVLEYNVLEFGQLRGSFKTKFAKRTAVRKNLVQLKAKMFYCDDILFLIFTSRLTKGFAIYIIQVFLAMIKVSMKIWNI